MSSEFVNLTTAAVTVDEITATITTAITDGINNTIFGTTTGTITTTAYSMDVRSTSKPSDSGALTSGVLKYFNRHQTITDWDILQLLNKYRLAQQAATSTNNSFLNDSTANLSLRELYNQVKNQEGNPQNLIPPGITGHNLDPIFANIAAFCFLLIIIVSVICNIVLICIIIRSKSLHKTMHVCIANLAVADLITSAGTMPFDVDFMLRGYFGHGVVACGVMHFTFLISLPSSVINLVLLTTERFVSVVFPFHRVRYITRRNVVISLAVTWVYTCCSALFPLVHSEDAVQVAMGRCVMTYPLGYDIYQIAANFLIPISYICFANCILFRVSNRHAAKIRSLSVVSALYHSEPSVKAEESENSDSLEEEDKITPLQSPKSESKGSSDMNDNNNSGKDNTVKNTNTNNTLRKLSVLLRIRNNGINEQRNSLQTAKSNNKAAKRLALLVGVFLFCWLTYIILVATNVSCGICHPRELTWIGNIINYSSSAVNPLLYGLLNAKIRRELKKPFKRFFEDFTKSRHFVKNNNFRNMANCRHLSASLARDGQSNVFIQQKLLGPTGRKATVTSLLLFGDSNSEAAV